MTFSTLQFSFQKDQQDILFTEQLPIQTMENPVSCWRPGAWADEESHEIQHYQFSTSLYGILNKALEDNDQWAMPNQNKTKKIRPSSPSQFSIFYVTFLTTLLISSIFSSFIWVCTVFQHLPVLARQVLWTNTDKASHSVTVVLDNRIKLPNFRRITRVWSLQLTWYLLEKPSKWKVFLRATQATS